MPNDHLEKLKEIILSQDGRVADFFGDSPMRHILTGKNRADLSREDLLYVLDHEMFLLDDEDVLGGWAIEYITTLHPLAQEQSTHTSPPFFHC